MNKQVSNNKNKQPLGIVAIRQAKVIKSLSKNVLNSKKITREQAMLDAGYSESYAKTGHIKSGKIWKQLIEEYLGDDLLIITHCRLLDSQRIEYMSFAPDLKDNVIYEIVEGVGGVVKKIVHSVGSTHCYFFMADARVQKDALELAYKIKGKMSPQKIEIDTKDKYRSMSNQELEDHINRLKAKFTKSD